VIASFLFFYIYLKNVITSGWSTSLLPLLLAVILSSLGFSTKWTAAFSLVAQFFILGIVRYRARNRKIDSKQIAFLNKNVILTLSGLSLIFLLVYFISYIPYMGLGHSFVDVLRRQWSMLGYHSQLEASHGFSSPWWSWPLLSRPVWLYISNLGDGKSSTMAVLGNPIIWWAGLILMAKLVLMEKKERTDSDLFLLVIFAFQWLPYSLISRSLFIYHYFPNIAILCLVISNQLVENYNEKNKKNLVIAYLLIVIILFIVYYPILSGFPIQDSIRKMLRILQSWVF
jgi:hypothetical protein